MHLVRPWQGLEPAENPERLRGAEAPLFHGEAILVHGEAALLAFFRNLQG
jgi:hypothetical protein